MLDEEFDLLASYGKDPNNVRAKSLWEALQMPTQPEAEDSEDASAVGGLGAVGGTDYTKQLLDLQRRHMSVQERQRQVRQQQLAEATELLRSRRLGPSRSEQLMQLSAAMLQPRRYKGFGATISNFLPVLAQQQADRREGETARADALLKLQQQYQNADMDSEAAAIKNEMDMIRIAAQAGRGNQPSIQLDEQGNLREVPKSNNVYRPTSPEEYAAIPRGAWYVVPGGAKAGTVVRKQ